MIEARFPRIARVASGIVIALGATVFIGWIVDAGVVKSVIPGLATMKANTAACFILAGAALWLQIAPGSPPGRVRVARALALVVASVAILTMIEHIFGVDLGIDQVLIRVPQREPGGPVAGQMGPTTAISFMLSGIVLALLDTRNRTIDRLLQPLTIAVFIIAFLAICGYSLSATALYGVAGYNSMAVHTAVGFAVLSTAILFARPQRGVVAIFAQDNQAGAGARHFIPLILVVPLIVGWFRLEGQLNGYYGTEFGVALMVTACTTILAFLVLRNARIQGASETERRLDTGDQTFLFELADLLRTSTNSSEILFQVSQNLGKYLRASRCYFNEIDLPNDLATIRHDYANDLRSLAGTLPVSGYNAESVAAATAGHTVVNNDTMTDARSAARYDGAYRAASMRSLIAVPLLRHDVWVATLIVTTHVPRIWEDREIKLTETVAERTWLWFEHLLALEALRQSEQNLAVTNSGLELRVESRTSALRAALKEREVLLQEVHHRVKNNLQVISSLINMQARAMSDEPSRMALNECKTRVQAIALIHEKLYQSKDYTNVPFSDYAKGLAANIFHATGVSQTNVALQVEISDLTLAVDKAIPCGLILNELITNALKHAFPDERSGTVRVELRQTGTDMLLAVSDDGMGMPPDFDPAHSASLGMQLVTTLIEQLDGQLEIVRGNGTDFRITFPVAGAA